MEILKANCQYCGKEITSLYANQLTFNLQAHEISCQKNPKNNELKKEDKKK